TYRGPRPPAPVRGRIGIRIDDGVATGASLRAALVVLRRSRPARIVVAVPVAAPEAGAALRAEVDEVIWAWTPEPFHAVGHGYEDFAPTSDAEVRDLLEGSARPGRAGADSGGRGEIPRPRSSHRAGQESQADPEGGAPSRPHPMPRRGGDQFAPGSPP